MSWSIFDGFLLIIAVHLLAYHACPNSLFSSVYDVGVPVSTIINGWSQSQDRDFYGQFSSGIRYVDLRACYDNVTQEWHTDHSVVLADPLSVLFNDTITFLRGQ